MAIKYKCINLILVVFFLTANFVFAESMSLNDLPKFKRSIKSFYKTKFNQPQSVFLDIKNKEMLLVDLRLNTIFIFDLEGTPIAMLDEKNGLDRPFDVVSRDSQYYVSQSNKEYIEVFDILGNSIKKLKPDNRKFSPGKLYLGFDGSLYVINKLANEVIVYDKEDKFLRAIGTDDPRLVSLSGAAIGYDRIYLFTPFTIGNAIHVYSLKGEYLHSFEFIAGLGNGSLGLPVSGVVDKDKNLWLVDSLRGVLVYNNEYKKINNFGTYDRGGVRKVLQFPIDIDFGMQNEVYILEKSLKQISIFR